MNKLAAWLGHAAATKSAAPKKSKKKTNGKKPGRAYGTDQVGVQTHLPINDLRELSRQEQYEVDNSRRNMFPTMMPSYGTPIHKLMSSPGWAAAGHGALGAIPGALLGGLAGASLAGEGRNNPSLAGGIVGAGLGGLATGGLGALTGYWGREQENANLEDLIRRLPEGKTNYRDMLSDSHVQSSMDRNVMSNAGTGNNLATYALVSALMNR